MYHVFTSPKVRRCLKIGGVDVWCNWGLRWEIFASGDDPHRVSRCYIISLELCESAESVVLIHPLGRMRTEKYVNGELIMLSNCKIHLRL